MNWQNIKDQLITFLKEEVENTGFNKVTVGLSGGLDSAVVAVLCQEVFGQNLKCILLPSTYSNPNSISDAKELCKQFNMAYEIVEIAPLMKTYLKNMGDDKLRIGNFSARMRMSVLYDISARDKSLVIGTSNKSELLLGYGTIFGDMACAINPIGEIYKSDAFEFADFLNVPQAILGKKPSADLWENQSDEDDLGFTYNELDEVMKLLIDAKKSKKEILRMGFNEFIIDTIEYRVKTNAFKGRLPKIAKINWS